MKTILIIFISVFAWTVSPPTAFSSDSRTPICPQVRKTKSAPHQFQLRKNPVENNKETLQKGKRIFENSSKPLQCKICHGAKGDGLGDPAFESTPPARNFTCKNTMKKIPDGQLFWIIKNGSKGTSMPAYKDLTDIQIWQLINYIRSLV